MPALDARNATRIALVETRHGTHARHHRVEHFPFLVGLADRCGWEARWFRVDVPSGYMHRGGRYVVGLPPAETAAIVSALAELRPAVVVGHDRFGDELIAAVRAELPDVRIVDLTGRVDDPAASEPAVGAPGREGGIHPHFTIGDVIELLGVDAPADVEDTSAFLLDAASPSFRHVAVGTSPTVGPAKPQPVRLAVEVTCAYRRPLAGNPSFAGVCAPVVERHLGCSFCLTAHAPAENTAGARRLKTQAVDLVLRQVEAHQAAEPAGTARDEYVFEETHFHARVDSFLEEVLTRELRPSVFWLTLRADMMLAARPRLESLLPALRDAGHALRFLSIGAENFSEVENERFHKGVSVERLWECHAMITDLEQRFPDTFQCPDDGHFVGILFTPWTTPMDLGINIDAARRLGPGWLHQMLGSRLQLWADAPITELARHDGLLAEPGGGVDDDAAICQMNPDDGEIAWRFRDPRAEAARRLLIRLAPIPETVILDPAKDELCREVTRLRAALPAPLRDDYVELAGAVVAAVDVLGADASAGAVFEFVSAAGATERSGGEETDPEAGDVSADASDRRALLLIECVTNERWVYDARYFPFVKGCAEQLGFDTRWHCFGSRITMAKSGYSEVHQFVDLGPAELARLKVTVAELRPTHVVISHELSDAALSLIRDGAPGVSVLSVSGHRPTRGVEWLHDVCDSVGGAPRTDASEAQEKAVGILASATGHVWQYGRTDWLLHWLGETPETSALFGQYLVGTVTPSYDAVMVNEKARSYKPHLLICGGVTCDHFKSVTANERFAGVDLSSCTHDTGCSYCTWYRGPTSNLRDDPVSHAEQQLRRIAETAGDDGRFQGIFDMLDVRLFKHVDRFFDMVVSLDLPPAIFCFEPRLDRFNDVAERLDTVLPKIQEAGHCIYLFRMGAENLVEEENVVFNKYVTLESIDYGMDRMEALAERYPGAFEHDPTWGYINCSPWTTLEMFELGIDRAIERRFEPTGVWLYTPLLMYRGSPIALLADKEGFLLEEYDDISLLYNPAVNQIPFEGLRPWRFRDERTGLAFALIVRFCAAALRHKYSDNLFDGDPLYAHLLGRESELAGFARPDVFAKVAIAAIKAAEAPYDKTELLDSALDAYPAAVDGLPEFVARFRGGVGRYNEITAFSDEEDSGSDDGSGADGDGAASTTGSAADDGGGAVASAPDDSAERITFLLGAVKDRFGDRFSDFEIGVVHAPPDRTHLDISLTIATQRYDLRLYDSAGSDQYFFQTDRFNVVHTNDIDQHSSVDVERMRQFLDVFGRAVAAYSPELMVHGG